MSKTHYNMVLIQKKANGSKWYFNENQTFVMVSMQKVSPARFVFKGYIQKAKNNTNLIII